LQESTDENYSSSGLVVRRRLSVATPQSWNTVTLPAGFTFLDPGAIPLLDWRTAALLALALALIGWIMSARFR
jgi:hypothetical protein